MGTVSHFCKLNSCADGGAEGHHIRQVLKATELAHSEMAEMVDLCFILLQRRAAGGLQGVSSEWGSESWAGS